MHDMWLPSIVDRRGPVYLAIVDSLVHAIQSGALRAGNRLPPQRLLADLLGINLSTVTRAYSEGERRHLIGGEVGRGTYVLAHSREVDLFALKELPDRTSIDLSTNVPPRPAHDADLEQTIGTLAHREALARFLHYPSSGDGAVHRGAAALWLKQRGIVADPARIVICSGAQHGVLTAISSLVSHGDTVLTEEFTYPGMKAIAARLGLKLKGVAMDADGVRLDAFTKACRFGAARTAVLMPSLHNPTTSTLTLARRKQLVEIAGRFGVTLIEEDVYGLLAKDAAPPLAALAPDSVLYVTSLSKTVAPGLRIGYLYGPAHLIDGIAQQVHMTTWLTCPLMAEIASFWISSGQALKRLRWQQRELRARHRIATDILAGHAYQSHPESPHLWLLLPRHLSGATFADQLRARGVAIAPSEFFSVRRVAPDNAVRVAIGAARTRNELKRALTIIAELLESKR